MVNITALQVGSVYKLRPHCKQQLLAQIAPGGDCALYCSSEDVLGAISGRPLLRVLVNAPDFRRHWEPIGDLPSSLSIATSHMAVIFTMGNRRACYLVEVEKIANSGAPRRAQLLN